MSLFDVRVDTSDMRRLAQLIRQAERKAPGAVAGGINETFGKARTQVVRALAQQTGAKYGDVRKALTYKRAHIGNLEASIKGRGPHLPLRMFRPSVRLVSLFNVQTRRKALHQVVSASPWGVKRQFPGMFMVGSWQRSGRSTRFVGSGVSAGGVSTNGQVFVRVGQSRLPIRRTFGPAIPKEMVKDETAAAFLKVAETMPDAVGRHLLGVMRGEAWTSRVGRGRRP